MINFEFNNPTKVIFGKDTESQVGDEISSRGYKKVLIHFGGTYLQENGVLDRVHTSLLNNQLEYIDFDGVVPNPRMSLVKEGIELCKKEKVDFILAIGGGSAIDSAKAIAYGIANDFELEDLFLGKVTTTKIAPIGCISTIAATGSETSNSTVIDIDTLGDTMLKRSYNHDCARPLFAIMNPELTYTLPTYQTASGSADIMMHTMERYFTNVQDVELTDRIGEGLLITVKKAALKVLEDPYNYEGRANLMWAGSLSHNGLTGTGRIGDFACHKIGHELSALYDVAHGASLTAIWSSWAKYVYKTNIPRFAQFAVEVFNIENDFHNQEDIALKGIEAWDTWCHKIGMPTSLTELNIQVTDSDIDLMAELAVNTGNGKIGFFYTLNKDDVIEIYKNARL